MHKKFQKTLKMTVWLNVKIRAKGHLKCHKAEVLLHRTKNSTTMEYPIKLPHKIFNIELISIQGPN